MGLVVVVAQRLLGFAWRPFGARIAVIVNPECDCATELSSKSLPALLALKEPEPGQASAEVYPSRRLEGASRSESTTRVDALEASFVDRDESNSRWLRTGFNSISMSINGRGANNDCPAYLREAA